MLFIFYFNVHYIQKYKGSQNYAFIIKKLSCELYEFLNSVKLA